MNDKFNGELSRDMGQMARIYKIWREDTKNKNSKYQSQKYLGGSRETCNLQTRSAIIR